MSLEVALKTTKEGSEGNGGKKEPTSTSRAKEMEEQVKVSLRRKSEERARPLRKILLGVLRVTTEDDEDEVES